MTVPDKKIIPIMEGFWMTPASEDEKPQLIGSKCKSCGELFFPRKAKGWCVCCQQATLEDVNLSRKGKFVSFSKVMQQPGGGFYKGPVPYAYGLVDLPEGIRIEALIPVEDVEGLEIGVEAELVIEKLCDDDEGNEIITFKFRPTGKN